MPMSLNVSGKRDNRPACRHSNQWTYKPFSCRCRVAGLGNYGLRNSIYSFCQCRSAIIHIGNNIASVLCMTRIDVVIRHGDTECTTNLPDHIVEWNPGRKVFGLQTRYRLVDQWQLRHGYPKCTNQQGQEESPSTNIRTYRSAHPCINREERESDDRKWNGRDPLTHHSADDGHHHHTR